MLWRKPYEEICAAGHEFNERLGCNIFGKVWATAMISCTAAQMEDLLLDSEDKIIM